MPLKTALAFWLGLTAGAMAGEFTVPQGCVPLLTVQKNACELTNHYRCDGSGKLGVYNESYGATGLDIAEFYTADHEFIKALEPGGETGIFAVPEKGRSFSLNQLLQNGSGTVRRFVQIRMGYVPQNPFPFNMDFTLTDEMVTIDGTDLQVGRVVMDIVIGPPFGSIHNDAELFIYEKDRLIITGRHTIRAGDTGTEEFHDEAPVKIIHPGQEGFMSKVPVYGCGEQMSGLPLNFLEDQG